MQVSFPSACLRNLRSDRRDSRLHSTRGLRACPAVPRASSCSSLGESAVAAYCDSLRVRSQWATVGGVRGFRDTIRLECILTSSPPLRIKDLLIRCPGIQFAAPDPGHSAHCWAPQVVLLDESVISNTCESSYS